MTRPLVSVLLALVFVSRAWFAMAATTEAEFGRGLSAFNAGDFKTAYEAWSPLADANEPRAEAGIGFMYHRGLGLPTDNELAAKWFFRAAEQGQAEGQLMLGLLYFYGTGVPQSYIHSYAWCELAQDFGQSDAQLCRDSAISYLSEADMREGYQMIADLRAKYGRRRN